MQSPSVAALAPDKLRPWHEAVADMWLIEPNLTQREIANRLNRSEYWLSIVVNSDVFKHYLAERKQELLDPAVAAGIKDRLSGLVSLAADRLAERIAHGGATNKELIGAINAGGRALGLGTAPAGPTLQNNLYVLPAPVQAPSAAAWVERVRETVDLPQPAA